MTGSHEPRDRPPSGRTRAAVLLAVALGVAPLAAPLPGLLLSWAAPAPILWLVFWGEPGAAAVAAGGVLAAAAALGGAGYLLHVVEVLAPMTLVLAWAVAGAWSVGRAVLGAVAAAVGVALVGPILGGADPVAAVREEAQRVAETFAALAAREAGEAVDAAVLARWLVRLSPAVGIASAAGAAWLNLAIVRRAVTGWAPLDPAVREAAPARPPLDAWYDWRAPEPLVFVLILGGLALLPGREVLTAIGLNLLIVVGLVYVWQGLAVVGFVFRVRRVPLPLRGAGYALAALQPAVAVVVGALGLADLWVDFRGRVRRAAARATDDADS